MLRAGAAAAAAYEHGAARQVKPLPVGGVAAVHPPIGRYWVDETGLRPLLSSPGLQRLQQCF